MKSSLLAIFSTLIWGAVSQEALPLVTTTSTTYPSFVITSTPLPACPSNVLCAHTVCIEEVHVLGTKTVTTTTTVLSTLIKPVTIWTTETSTTTVPGKDCTVTSHIITSRYDTSTVEATTTNFITIDSTVYATTTVVETVSQLCDTTPKPDPSPGSSAGDDSTSDPVTSSVTILEYELDYKKRDTPNSVSLTSSTTLPLPITRTATVDENPTPSRVSQPICAQAGKLTYSLLQGHGWDNLDIKIVTDPVPEFNFGPLHFKSVNLRYSTKQNIIEQGTHPVIEATTGQLSLRATDFVSLLSFVIELPQNAALDDVLLNFELKFGSTATYHYSLIGGSYGQRKSPAWEITNLQFWLPQVQDPKSEFSSLSMTLKRTDTGALVPFDLRQPFQDIDTSSKEWVNQLCGPNLRWESIGLLWSVLRRIPESFEPIEKNQLHILESGTANKPVLAFLRHSINLARHFTLANIIILDLLFQKATMESMIVGDASLICWGSFADAVSVMTYLGIHAEKLTGPYKPSLSSEHKRRLFGRVYNLEKAIVALTGRPLLLNPRFRSTPPPLDLSDEDLLAGGAVLERAVFELDSRGWNLRGGVYPSILALGLMRLLTLRNLKQRQLNAIAELPWCLVYDPDNSNDLPLPRAEIRSYDKDLSDPPVEANVVSLKIFIRLTHLQNVFLLERLLLQYGCPDEGDVLLVSYEMIRLTLMFWMHKDRFRDIRRDMEWLLMAFAVPGGGILCLELLSPTFQGKHPKDNRLSRSSIVQQLSLLVGFLDWVHPSAPNSDLCASCGALQSIATMAATSTTPELATMPTEIICMIGDNLSIHEIKDWTLVSKQFREILLPKLCKHLKFSGNMKKLTSSLNAYFTRKTASFRHLVRHQARLVTFEVTSFNNLRELNAWLVGYGVENIPIGRFLADTPSLQIVFFDLYLPYRKEAHKFISLIRKGPDWHGPKYLYFKKSPEHYHLAKIVGKFKAGALRGICAPPGMSLDDYDELARNGAKLTSLRLDKYFCIYYDDSISTGLNGGLASRINKSFPRLESLNIYDGYSFRLRFYRDHTNSNRWCQDITKAASILANLQRLRRFAFTMDPVEHRDVTINSITAQLLAMMETKGLVPFEVHGVEDVYKLVIAYFAAHAKGLEEICITTRYPMFYRATLTDGAWNMSEESSEDPSQKYLFPNGLGN
ncbi:hypothetical protein FAGAP_8023 [Fusarium agapanthi]|uniref:F-box domain-containing protein n=1 Tax=Fusarium agapanthi TaxID=1803897 RepID=A0A9P5B772_9HYPO|nr:hypothetical protein FAGAP_8023 [Fusarium agapanthi]